VRTLYPREVREHRRCRDGNLKQSALIVHIDADTGTVANRHRQLADALNQAGAGGPPRTQDERIAIIVPKRHTETWLHGLFDPDITEDRDCKRDGRLRKLHDERVPIAAEEIYRLTRANAPPPPTNLPSLAAAIPELRRLESR
jgi:hypothetical protein